MSLLRMIDGRVHEKSFLETFLMNQRLKNELSCVNLTVIDQG